MEVTVQFEAQLRQAAEQDSMQVELQDGCCLLEAVREVAQQSTDALADRLLDSDRSPRPSVLLFVNDQPVHHDSAATTQLRSGDRVMLFPPISGG